MEGRGSLEEQLEAVKRKAGEITAKKESLRVVEERGAQIEEALIFDNKYNDPCNFLNHINFYDVTIQCMLLRIFSLLYFSDTLSTVR